MTSEIFVDTAGWGNILDRGQRFHRLSVEIYRESRENGALLVTTNYVIAELVALLASPLRFSREKVIAFIDNLRKADHIRILHVDRDLDEKAWSLLKERRDKEWSLVDAASFVIMRDRGISSALTSDHHFEQAGFRCLLKEDR